jgi:hypothetical protein
MLIPCEVGGIMKQLAIVFALAAIAFAQDPKPTSIGAHRLGESFDEWMTAAKLDLADICGGQHPKSDKRMDYKQVCKTLTTLKSGGPGWFKFNETGSVFTWTFANARTTKAESVHITSAASVLAQLSEAYGMPSATRTVPYQNALGAHWDCLEADWLLPDGAVILAKENLGTNFSRYTVVTFLTRELAAQLSNQPKAPNPFLAK